MIKQCLLKDILYKVKHYTYNNKTTTTTEGNSSDILNIDFRSKSKKNIFIYTS